VPGKGLEIFAAMASTNLDHDLGVTIDPEGRRGLLNHVAYAVESRKEVLLAADAAVESGLTIELGPAEHARSAKQKPVSSINNRKTPPRRPIPRNRSYRPSS
jgi:hypothetical protein